MPNLDDIITKLSGTPLPLILVIAGLIFLFASVVRMIRSKDFGVEVANPLAAGILGFVLLLAGIGLYTSRPATEASIPPTVGPVTGVPPTTFVQPTALPTTTLVEPSAIPPTHIPPTDVPPTDIPPTDVPPALKPMEPQSEALTRYNEIYNQNGWCALWNALIDDNLVVGNCPDSVTQMPKAENVPGNPVYAAQMRINSELQINYPACATFSTSAATAEGGKVISWRNNDYIGTNITMKANSFFTLYFRCEEEIAP
jgi:hypothetical protein